MHRFFTDLQKIPKIILPLRKIRQDEPGTLNETLMNNRLLKIVYTVFMALLLMAVVAFMVIHIMSGLADSTSKMLLGGYVLLVVWASYRLYSLIRSLKE